jgi:hypothetical protein
MKSLKIFSTALFVSMLVLIPVLAQQSNTGNNRNPSGSTSGQMGQNQTSGQMSQNQTSMEKPGMENLVGANVYASDQKTKLGTISDIQSINGQDYFLILGTDNNIHPVPVGVIAAVDLNLKQNEFRDSPSFSMNQPQTGSTWTARTDSYFEKYEVTRPVSQNMGTGTGTSGRTGTQPQGGTR